MDSACRFGRHRAAKPLLLAGKASVVNLLNMNPISASLIKSQEQEPERRSILVG